MADWCRGQLATWLHTPRGGYGFTRAVPVEVIEVTPKRVKVLAPLRDGGFRPVFVDPKKLVSRAAPEGERP